MMKTSDDLIFLGVYDRFVEPIYRYHLARRGSQHEAENLTRATFQSLFRSNRPARLGAMDGGRLSDLVYRTAIRLQRAVRRGQVTDGLVTGDPNDEQPALFQRAQFAALAEHWASLPALQADALALAAFAGLDLGDIARLLHRSPASIQAILAAQGKAVASLGDLAGQARPPAEFTTGLADELTWAPAQGGPASGWWTRLVTAVRFPLWGAGQWGKFTAASLAGALLGFGLWVTLLNPGQPAAGALAAHVPQAQVVSATETPIPSLSADIGATGNAATVGYLVPPDQTVCEDWRSSLSQLVDAPYPLALTDNAPIDDPSTSGPEGAGFGCFVDLTSDGPLFRVNMSSVQSYVTGQGFARLGTVSTPCPTPNGDSSLYSFEQACTPSRTTTWVSAKSSVEQKVVVELISQQPFRGGTDFGFRRGTLVTPDSPTPTPYWSSPDTYDPCMRFFTGAPCTPDVNQLQQSRFILRVGIATTSIRQAIDNFLYQWAADQSGAMSLVSSQLRASQPDLASLDKLVGILRRPDLSVRLTWQVINNTGRQVSVMTNADEPSALALPDQHSDPFTVVFSQVSGHWQVSSVARLVN